MFRTILAFAILLTSANLAQAANIYEIKGVSVTVTESDTGKARQKAMAEANTKAFDELQKKLVASGYITAPKTLTQAQIDSTVDSVDIVSEKSSSKTYKGTYNVIFNPVDVSRVFNIGVVEQLAEPEKYLLIPSVVENGTQKVWKNEWLNNFQAKRDDLVLPLGDLQDVQSYKTEDLKTKKFDGLFRMQKRYGATAIALVKGEYLPEKNALAVELQKIKGQERVTVTYEYPGGAGISSFDLFNAAADDIIYRLQTGKLTDNSSTVDAPPTAPAAHVPEPYSPNAPGAGFIGETKYPANPVNPAATPTPPAPPPMYAVKPQPVPDMPSVDEIKAAQPARTDINVTASDLIVWNRIRSKLIDTPGVKDLKIKSFAGGRANISIANSVEMSELVAPLAAKGLDLSQDASQAWQIKEKQ